MIRHPFRSGVGLTQGRPVVASLAAVILAVVLFVQASAAAAATLSEDMVQASKDACINLAKRRGFTVEQVINAQPATGDSASVVLKLMKAGAPYEFKCGFSQAIDHFVEPAAAVPAQRAAVAPAPAPVAQRPQARVNVTADAPRTEARQEVRRERAEVVVRNRQGNGNVSADRGRFNALWLLPLLLLPLAAILFRNKEEETVATSRVASPAIKSTIVEALLRSQDSAIEVRSGAGTDHAVTRTIPAGSRVRLSGRYENDWAELAETGWISIQALSADPRVTAVKSYSA
ncbi:MAG: SH3 domain-containing protein [Cyanobacteriota bacterium]|jgi:hypothetical protein